MEYDGKRRLTLSELLSAANRLFAGGLGLIVILNLAAYLPVFIANVTFMSGMGSLLALANAAPEEALRQLQRLSPSIYAAFGVNLVFAPLAAGGFAYLARAFTQGRKPDMAGLLNATLARWGKHLVTAVLYNAVLLLSACLIVPMLYFGVSFGFANEIVTLEGVWGPRALGQSFRLVKGRWWRTMLFLLLSGLAGAVVSFVMSLVLSLVFFWSNSVVLGLAVAMVSQIFASYFQVLTALWFINTYDLSRP